MNITQYNQKRDELTNLLQKVIASLDEIEEKYTNFDVSSLNKTKEEIEVIKRKVYEDIYKLVLVSRFQGGKSTSFNAITGGSCYSPMGNGSIKCSASPIMSRSVVDEKEQGATVYMRSKEELEALLAAGGFSGVDLGDEKSFEEAKEDWHERFECWKTTPGIFKSADELDMFIVAGFVITFYNDPVIQSYLKQKTFAVSFADVGKYATFPKNYSIRYSEAGPAAFEAHDVVYAFVKKINLRVQSLDMQKIGASFVDAPGLFVNEYDTNITLEELMDASAVWYLLPAKQPGAEEIKAMKTCLELVKNRVFFSANLIDNQTSKPTWIDSVLPAINTNVNNALGEKVILHPYHALLALLYTQGEYYVEHGHWVDDSVRVALQGQCEKFGVPNYSELATEECWRIVARIAIQQLYPWGLPEFAALSDSLSAEGLAILRRESNWDGTVEAIRELVINSKSEEILINGSSQKALDLIQSLKDLLTRWEQDAQKTFDEVSAEYTEAEKKLTDFLTYTDSYIAKRFEDAAGNRQDKLLAENLFTRVFEDSISSISIEAAPEIYNKTGVLKVIGAGLGQCLRNVGRGIKAIFTKYEFEPAENALAVEIRNIISTAVNRELHLCLAAWLNSVKNGENDTFKTTILTPARDAYEHLLLRWNANCATDDILSCIAPVTPTMPNVLVNGRFETEDLMGLVSSMPFKELLKDLGTLVVAWWLLPEPFVVIVGFVVMIVRRALKEDQLIASIKQELEKGLRTKFAEVKDDVIKKATPRLSVFREAVINAIKKPFELVKKKFIQAKDNAFRLFVSKQMDKSLIAKDCKNIRENYIDGEAGLEKQLQDYIEDTRPLCAQSLSVQNETLQK